MHDGFFRQAERQPDAPAVFADSGDLSYAQLRDQALAVAAALRAAGAGAGDTVAVVGPKSAEQIPAVLGILSVGAAYLPIGADQPRDRAERILQSGRVRLALVCGGRQLSLPVPGWSFPTCWAALPRTPRSPARESIPASSPTCCSPRGRPESRRASKSPTMPR